ncbi:hypothetical protein BO79DRAFT_221892 [Aspergillus costaricaensis CBS 115574]|uniref:Uncharacterized protein n=1 Tax=Aspergillus costaricaensis CBS 115574 TaxID=1448317 RepID=A0ACD1I1N4_9EURO|nr:hypothetical protein BO79DRAFT_221892 [Aspergillus costaricaensis CBS 115574]RAK84247.1 hypothetical protein BO79DRAFT_221892 [Aspergillus costaricaensis CBS 115574]
MYPEKEGLRTRDIAFIAPPSPNTTALRAHGVDSICCMTIRLSCSHPRTALFIPRAQSISEPLERRGSQLNPGQVDSGLAGRSRTDKDSGRQGIIIHENKAGEAEFPQINRMVDGSVMRKSEIVHYYFPQHVHDTPCPALRPIYLQLSHSDSGSPHRFLYTPHRTFFFSLKQLTLPGLLSILHSNQTFLYPSQSAYQTFIRDLQGHPQRLEDIRQSTDPPPDK